MAEIKQLIDSLAMLTATGLKSAKLICAIVDELGEAASQIKGIATDLKAVSWILHGLKNHLNKAPTLSPQVQDIVCEIIELCREDIADIERFLEPLRPSSDSTIDRTSKIKWVFTKSKVTSRRASLDSLKLTLNPFVNTLDFISSGKMDEFVKDEVESLIMQCQATKTVLLNAERIDRQSKAACQAEPLQAIPQLEYHESSIETEKSEEAFLSNPESGLTETSNPAMEESTAIQLGRPRSAQNPTQEIDDIPENDFVQIAEHLKLQIIVRRFAVSTIYTEKDYDPFYGFARNPKTKHNDNFSNKFSNAGNKGTESFGSNSESAELLRIELERSRTLVQEREEEIKRLQSQLEHFHRGEEIGNLRAKLRQIEEAEEDKRQREKEERYMKEAEARVRWKIEAERRDAEERVRKEAEARHDAEEVARAKVESAMKAEAKANALAEERAEELRRKIEDETTAKLADAAKAAEQLPIRFKDAVGRKFNFPFHQCATWSGMEELVKQAFLQVDVLGPHVQEGHYDLIGPDGDLILPSVWEKVIQPDWNVTMTMWPIDKLPPVVTNRGRPSPMPRPPGVEARPPGFEARPPGFEVQPPSVEARPPGFEARAPGFEARPPGVEARPLGVENRPPESEASTLSLVGIEPKKRPNWVVKRWARLRRHFKRHDSDDESNITETTSGTG